MDMTVDFDDGLVKTFPIAGLYPFNFSDVCYLLLRTIFSGVNAEFLKILLKWGFIGVIKCSPKRNEQQT